MKYTLIAVDPVKKHVTFEMEDGIRQTVGDFPVDDAVALEQALVNYASQYHSPVEEKAVENKDVTAMIGQEKQVVDVKIDDSVKPTAFDASLSLEEVKQEVVASIDADVAEAIVTETGVEITTVKPEPVVESPIEVAPEVVSEPVSEPVAEVVEPVVEVAPEVVEPVVEAPVETPVEAPVVEETPVSEPAVESPVVEEVAAPVVEAPVVSDVVSPVGEVAAPVEEVVTPVEETPVSDVPVEPVA